MPVKYWLCCYKPETLGTACGPPSSSAAWRFFNHLAGGGRCSLLMSGLLIARDSVVVTLVGKYGPAHTLVWGFFTVFAVVSCIWYLQEQPKLSRPSVFTI